MADKNKSGGSNNRDRSLTDKARDNSDATAAIAGVAAAAIAGTAAAVATKAAIRESKNPKR